MATKKIDKSKSAAKAPTPAAPTALAGVRGHVDTTYTTAQRDMFSSGLVAQIGVHSYATWAAIKYHADFQSGESWPGIRRLAELTGMSTRTVQESIKTLEKNYLLRVTRKGSRNIYVARERLDVRVGKAVICSVAIDYVPATMRERLEVLLSAATGSLKDHDVWAEVDVIPGPGMKIDTKTGTFRGKLRVDEVPTDVDLSGVVTLEQAKERLQLEESGEATSSKEVERAKQRKLRDEMAAERAKPKSGLGRPPKK